ncbi:MAG: hypothetical protein ACRDXX_13320, partial [Stackebrandtia sp.]
MAANTDYEEFVAFVAAAESDLRYASNLAVGDPSTSRLLMRKALARTAQRWRLARADDPHRFLLNAIESEANTLWRVEDPDPDLEVGSVDTALSLADEAWDEGLRLRARRRRNVAVAVGVIALLVGAY